MAEPNELDQVDLTLLDLVDHVLNKGVVLTGEATISVAGVDLIYLGLNVVLASMTTIEETLTRGRGTGGSGQWAVGSGYASPHPQADTNPQPPTPNPRLPTPGPLE